MSVTSKLINNMKAAMSDFVTDSTLAYMTYLGASMNDMRLRNKFVDTVLICGEKKFSAHRLVLCSRSPVFQRLLLQESNTHSGPSAVDLEDIEPKVLEVLLEFMYLGRINKFNELALDGFNKILTATELLNVNGGVLYLTHTLLERKPEEAITILWDWAFEFGNEEVVQLVIAFIADHIHMAILSHPKLTERDPQDDVMEAILSWIRAEPKSREDFFTNFVSFVAIHRLSNSYVQRLMRDEPLIQQLADFQRIMTSYHPKSSNRSISLAKSTSFVNKQLEWEREREKEADIPDDNSSVPQKFKPKIQRSSTTINSQKGLHFYDLWTISASQMRNTQFSFPEAMSITEGITLMILGRDEMNRFVAHLYIPEKLSWSLSHEITIPNREKMSFALHKGKLFLIGGEDPYQRKQPDVFVFNLLTQLVSEGPPMRISRCKAGIAQDKGSAYIAGGLNRFGNFMTHVECLDMVAEVWRIVPPMKEKRQSPGLAVVNGELFAVGGFTNRCESYDPHWDSWQSVVPMPDFFSQTAVVTAEFNNKIYAFRYFKPDRVCCLDPSKNEWRVIRTTGMPPERILSIHNIEGELWTLDRCGRLYVFDVVSNAWVQSFCCPKSLTRPMYLFVMNVAEVKHVCEPPKLVQSLS
uniref:BTB domain-containing protein n=1 Tax=Strigamia maritima TaxID=126957 RepID=T1IND2_STRMM